MKANLFLFFAGIASLFAALFFSVAGQINDVEAGTVIVCGCMLSCTALILEKINQ